MPSSNIKYALIQSIKGDKKVQPEGPEGCGAIHSIAVHANHVPPLIRLLSVFQPRARILGLVEGSEAIHIGVVQKEQGVKRCCLQSRKSLTLGCCSLYVSIEYSMN